MRSSVLFDAEEGAWPLARDTPSASSPRPPSWPSRRWQWPAAAATTTPPRPRSRPPSASWARSAWPTARSARSSSTPRAERCTSSAGRQHQRGACSGPVASASAARCRPSAASPTRRLRLARPAAGRAAAALGRRAPNHLQRPPALLLPRRQQRRRHQRPSRQRLRGTLMCSLPPATPSPPAASNSSGGSVASRSPLPQGTVADGPAGVDRRGPGAACALTLAVLLRGEAAVPLQQYLAVFHDVRWIGPLFVANAAGLRAHHRRPDPTTHPATGRAGGHRDLRARPRQPRRQLRQRTLRLARRRLPHPRRPRPDHQKPGAVILLAHSPHRHPPPARALTTDDPSDHPPRRTRPWRSPVCERSQGSSRAPADARGRAARQCGRLLDLLRRVPQRVLGVWLPRSRKVMRSAS